MSTHPFHTEFVCTLRRPILHEKERQVKTKTCWNHFKLKNMFTSFGWEKTRSNRWRHISKSKHVSKWTLMTKRKSRGPKNDRYQASIFLLQTEVKPLKLACQCSGENQMHTQPFHLHKVDPGNKQLMCKGYVQVLLICDVLDA